MEFFNLNPNLNLPLLVTRLSKINLRKGLNSLICDSWDKNMHIPFTCSWLYLLKIVVFLIDKRDLVVEIVVFFQIYIYLL